MSSAQTQDISTLVPAPTPPAGNRNLALERPTLQTRGAATLRRYPTEFVATVRIEATSPMADVADKVAEAQRSVVARVDAALRALSAGEDEVVRESLPVIGDANGRSGRRAEALISVTTNRAIDDRVRLARLAQAVVQALRLTDGDWKGDRGGYVFSDAHAVRFRQTRVEDINSELRLNALKMARDRAIAEAAVIGMRVVRLLGMTDETVHMPRAATMAYEGAAASAPEPDTPDVSLQAELFTDAVLCTWEIA